MKISLVINCDNRNQNDSFTGVNLGGCVNDDFLTEGIKNKIAFLDGFDKEVIIHLDKHQELPISTLVFLEDHSDTLLIRNHTHETNFNCYNYLRALQLASNDIVFHIDQDTSCFTPSKDSILKMIDWLNEYSFVSYPSYWSPRAVHDESFGNRTWASTRFFLCKKEALKFDELYNCVKEPEWGYAKYGDSPRRCNWTEHYLSLINNDSVFYPPMNLDYVSIFSWGSYKKGILKQLNNMSYEEIKNWLHEHPIVYPNDVHI